MSKKNKAYNTMDGQIHLYHTTASRFYQAYLKLPDGSWLRKTTGTEDLDKASEIAMRMLIQIQEKIKANIPITNRKFKDVAFLTIQEIQDEIKRGELNKISGTTKIGTINRLHIPFFGNYHIERITDELMGKFSIWRTEQYKKRLKRATVKNQFTALRRVFLTAQNKGWVKEHQIPRMNNEGLNPERRPTFEKMEYMGMPGKLEWWCKDGKTQRVREIREFVWDLVEVIAGTGMRPGREQDEIRWKHIQEKFVNGNYYTTIYIPSGKTGPREIMADHSLEYTFKRMKARFPDVTDEDLVFRTRSGILYKDIRDECQAAFKEFLTEHGLLYDREGKERVLYSLRHFYGTKKLQYRDLDMPKLAKQMGTQVRQIEKHYSHLEAVLAADDIVGPPKQERLRVVSG